MSVQRVGRPRLQLQIPHRKHVEFEQSPCLTIPGCALSPDLQPATPPTCAPFQYHGLPPTTNVFRVAQYMYEQQLDSVGDIKIFKAFHCDTQEEYILKEMPIEKYRDILAPYWRVGSHENINEIEEIILGETKAYVFFSKHYGDLHSYVRSKRKLKEAEAVHLFNQIVQAIYHCHENGVILRDMKLRKFVFKNPERTELKLESLEDACLLNDDDDDTLSDKHGCPAYVSPEILESSDSYSGKAADVWSLGVMLYTMLIGRYPFHDVEPSALFSKIRRGDYRVPDTISTRAKCIVRNMLRHNPCERLSTEEILLHPWFKSTPKANREAKLDSKLSDQAVPEISGAEDEEESLFV